MKKPETIKTHFIKKPDPVCKYESCSPYPDEEVSFNYLNVSFPFPHTHDYWEILVIIDSSLNHTVNGKSFTLKIGDICLIRPSDSHFFSFNAAKEVKTVTFLIKSDYMRRFLATYSENLYDEIIDSDEIFAEKMTTDFITSIMPTILAIQSNVLDGKSRLFQTKIIVNRLIDKLIFSHFGFKDQKPGWFNDFLMTLNSPHFNFDNMEELARKTPYSYSRLSRIFKAHTGYTIVEYLSSIKINSAKESLLYTDKTISEISQELGYASISHFNRTFKKIIGTSPSEFRKKNK